ncbi:hypothetical protein DIPPA_57496 [Diplonema papillatum]|nr:hypothetical protein DIPPA_57496 [Diplonema papillatum]
MLTTASSAQQARLLKAMRVLKPRSSEMDLKIWMNNHLREKGDQEFSRIQEEAWEPYMPGSTDHRSQKSATFSEVGRSRGGPVRQHSLPLFPGEYHANPDDVQSLSVQNLKGLYSTVAREGEMFSKKHDLLLRIPSLDYEKIEELVSNLFPNMEREESNALLAKVVQSIQLGVDNEHVAEKKRILTSEMLQLQGYPQTFTAMVEAIGRRKQSKAHKVSTAREEFYKNLNFKWEHLQSLRRNAHLLGDKYTNTVPDIVDVVYDIYKDYIDWLEKAEGKSGEESEEKIPISERQVNDEHLQYAYGTGYRRNSEAVCRLRENADGNGKMSTNGSVPIAHFRGNVHAVEVLLQPFDECDLNVFDFDVDIEVFVGSQHAQAEAARVAISNALVKMLPHTKVYLHMASFLYPDPVRRRPKFTGERAAGVRYHWVKRGNPHKMFA